MTQQAPRLLVLNIFLSVNNHGGKAESHVDESILWDGGGEELAGVFLSDG